MRQQRSPFFPHRRNPDGTYNSICLICLQMVAKDKTEEELKQLDERHVCSTASIPRETPETSAELE
jgi:hypothetical protein